MFSFLYINDYHNFHELYFYSSDLARSASVAKNLYTFGEYTTQTLPLLALDDYSDIPLSETGYWPNSDRQPFSILCISFLKTLFPFISISSIAQAYTFLMAFAVMLVVLILSKVAFGSYSVWAAAILAMFPNFLVQVISKGGEDVLFFSLQLLVLLAIVKNHSNAKRFSFKFVLYISVVGLLYSRFYLEIFFLLPFSYIYFKYESLRTSLIYIALVCGLSFSPWLYFNYSRFGELLFNVNSNVQIWFDLPMSYFSNTWWVFKLKASEAPVFEVLQKSLQFLYNNVKFFIINWTSAFAALFVCVKKWTFLSRHERFILVTSLFSLLLSLLIFSPFAFAGAVVDYFIFLVPLFVLLKLLVIKQLAQGNLVGYEKILLISTIVFYLIRKSYGLEIAALLLNLVFMMFFIIFLKQKRTVFCSVFFAMLCVREVPDWKHFASDFAIRNIESVSETPQFRKAELIFSLNGFWSIALFTNAKVLPLPEEIVYIDEIATSLNVPLDKVIILIGNPPENVREFKIPSSSQVYVDAFENNQAVGSYKYSEEIKGVKLWYL